MCPVREGGTLLDVPSEAVLKKTQGRPNSSTKLEKTEGRGERHKNKKKSVNQSRWSKRDTRRPEKKKEI